MSRYNYLVYNVNIQNSDMMSQQRIHLYGISNTFIVHSLDKRTIN
jgi:hypothetical protein